MTRRVHPIRKGDLWIGECKMSLNLRWVTQSSLLFVVFRFLESLESNDRRSKILSLPSCHQHRRGESMHLVPIICPNPIFIGMEWHHGSPNSSPPQLLRCFKAGIHKFGTYHVAHTKSLPLVTPYLVNLKHWYDEGRSNDPSNNDSIDDLIPLLIQTPRHDHHHVSPRQQSH